MHIHVHTWYKNLCSVFRYDNAPSVIHQLDDSDSEIEFVGEQVADRSFQPVDPAWQAQKCHQLQLSLCRYHDTISGPPTSLGDPREIRPVAGDGNCWFRSISVAVTGDQEDHLAIRRAVVNFMAEPARDPPLRQHHMRATTAEYLIQSSMASSGTWATDCEILATAGLLETDIYVFSRWGKLDAWQKFAASDINPGCRSCVRSIYIKHHNQHYEYVVNVQSRIG